MVQRLGPILQPGCWGRVRALGRRGIKGRLCPSTCLAQKEVDDGGDDEKEEMQEVPEEPRRREAVPSSAPAPRRGETDPSISLSHLNYNEPLPVA